MFDSLLNALFVVGLNYVICEKEVTVKTSTVETLMGSCSFPCNLTTFLLISISNLKHLVYVLNYNINAYKQQTTYVERHRLAVTHITLVHTAHTPVLLHKNILSVIGFYFGNDNKVARKRQTASRAIREPEVKTLLMWKIEHEHKMSNICYKTYL